MEQVEGLKDPSSFLFSLSLPFFLFRLLPSFPFLPFHFPSLLFPFSFVFLPFLALPAILGLAFLPFSSLLFPSLPFGFLPISFPFLSIRSAPNLFVFVVCFLISVLYLFYFVLLVLIHFPSESFTILRRYSVYETLVFHSFSRSVPSDARGSLLYKTSWCHCQVRHVSW